MRVLAMGAEEFADREALPAVAAELEILTEHLWQGDRAFTHPYYWSGFTLVGTPW